jgi:hypothetical protein
MKAGRPQIVFDIGMSKWKMHRGAYTLIFTFLTLIYR